MILFLLLLILAGVGLAFYATENTSPHTVTFWNWHWSGVADWVPVVVVAAIIGVLFLLYMMYSGAVHGVRLGSMRRRVSTREQAVTEMRAENQRLREENARLRAQPRTGPAAPAGAPSARPAVVDRNPNVNPDTSTASGTSPRGTTAPAYQPRPTFGERVRAFFSGRQPAGY